MFVILFLVFVLLLRFLVYFIYLFVFTLFSSIVFAFKALTNPNENPILAIIKTPFVLLSTLLFGLIANFIVSLLYVCGINVPPPKTKEQQ